MENDPQPQDEIEDQDYDLNFYDLLEGFTDRIDSISQRSEEFWMEMNIKTTEKLSFLVEERKKDSRQRWQRTKEEVDDQKRLLKIQLEKP